MRTNHNASGKPSLEGCVGLRYPLRWVLQATYPWVCGILTISQIIIINFVYYFLLCHIFILLAVVILFFLTAYFLYIFIMPFFQLHKKPVAASISLCFQIQHTIYAKIKKKGMQKKCQKKISKQNSSV